jgi:chromosome partitioning protein
MNMRTIAIVSQKGGAGKTTLAVHLAAEAAADGVVTLLIDTNPQATASRWSAWRKGSDPEVIDCGAPSLLAGKLAKAQELGAQLVIIDTPPHADAMARQAARLADLILVPCRPKAFDLAAIEATADLIKSNGKPAYAVMMAGPPRAPLIYAEAADVIEGAFGLPIAPARLPERAAFHRSTAFGQTAREHQPSGRAAEEVDALWRWTRAQVGVCASEPLHVST